MCIALIVSVYSSIGKVKLSIERTKKDEPHLPTTSRQPAMSIIENAELKTFTNAGGTFYSPTHEVRVDIPQESLPPTIKTFQLKMTASLRGPYKFSEDCELCTAVIHLTTDPPIDLFHDWVTVEIPHCATEPCTGCVLDYPCIMTAKDELISGYYEFHEDPEIQADFLEDKVVFKTKHFSRSTGVRRQQYLKLLRRVQKQKYSKQHSSGFDYRSTQRKEKPASTKHSVSFPDSTASCLLQHTIRARNKYYVAMCTPNDKSQPQWNVVFLISYCIPTGLKVYVSFFSFYLFRA